MKNRSHVREIIEEAMKVEEDEENQGSPLAPLTVRLNQSQLDSLQVLAQEFGKTKSALGAELLFAAINDAVQTYWELSSPEARERFNQARTAFMKARH